MQEKFNINGIEYTMQKVAPREWLRLRDRTKNKYGQTVEEDMYSEILKHVVVDPKRSLDDFTELEELEEVVTTAIQFQQGGAR